jgi:hypothetical protein
MCFEKTFVQTSLRQKSRHTLVGLDFATIIVEHGKARPHRRIGCCIHCNPIVLSLTNKAGNNLITAISTERSPSCELDVPDLPDFQSLFSCHRSLYLPQVALPDLPFLWALHASAPYLTYEVSLCSLRLSRNHHLIQCHISEIDPGNFIKSQEQTRTLFLTPR